MRPWGRPAAGRRNPRLPRGDGRGGRVERERERERREEKERVTGRARQTEFYCGSVFVVAVGDSAAPTNGNSRGGWYY